jgi:hypothetical protein
MRLRTHKNGQRNIAEKIPERVGGNGNDTLGALLAGEARRVLQGLVGEGGEVEAVGVVVGDPGAGGHGQHRLPALHPHTEQLHRPRPDIPRLLYHNH